MSGVKMVEGHFYRSYDGNLWCCFKIDEMMKQAKCVRQSDSVVASFDFNGTQLSPKFERGNTLMEDMTLYWESLCPERQRLTDEIAVLKESNENLRCEVRGLLRKLNPEGPIDE